MIKLLQWLTRIAGLAALLLGMSFWGNRSPGAALITTHMSLGAIVVIALAILAIRALGDRVRVPAAFVALVWAALTFFIGTLQDWWVGGGSHLAIQIVHPLLGFGAIGLAEMLSAAIIRRRKSLA
jgi:hypothetical protein